MSDNCCCGCAGCSTAAPANPPDQPALVYRRGAYSAAWERMRTRLTSAELPGLRALAPRDTSDPALALLDAWACVSEVLGFYNERIINECYLRTCVERRSALELARLVGYAPRPGLAADVYLAFTFDDLNKEAEIEAASSTRAYSQPGPGETMQPFETIEPLRGRPRWSAMRPRLSAPQQLSAASEELFIKGASASLRAGDTLLFEFNGARGRQYQLRRVQAAEAQPTENRTRVTLQPLLGRSAGALSGAGRRGLGQKRLRTLIKAPGLRTSSAARLKLNPDYIFRADSYAPLGLLRVAYPALRDTLAAARTGAVRAEPTGAVRVWAMRVKAAIHGHNAQPPAVLSRAAEREGDPEAPERTDEWRTTSREWVIGETIARRSGTSLGDPPERRAEGYKTNTLPLDAVYDQIASGSLVAIDDPDIKFDDKYVFTVATVATVSRTDYNLPARVTQLTLDRPWLNTNARWLDVLRNKTIYAASEELSLAEQPVTAPVGGATLELDGFYDGLQPGRRLIVAGERADLKHVTGVRGAELVMIAAVSHTADTPAAAATTEALRTRLTLAAPGLQYTYHPASLTIYGNVAHATHGEQHPETLGSGSAARSLQAFGLRHSPLTYIAAPTPSGAASTLDVRVNDLRWHEAPDAAAIGPDERRYIVQHNDEGATRLVFGLGARPPSGQDNLRAIYRSGLGAAGNVRAGQISVLASRPNGVIGVNNPLAASGGADRDGLDEIRARTPLGLAALDRLVSADDIADFARAFAGIGKASVEYIPPDLHLTIAGVDDAPITRDAALLTNLKEALLRYGEMRRHPADANQPDFRLQTRGSPEVTVTVQVRRAKLLALSARVRLRPDFLWEQVRPQIEGALYTAFGFRQRGLGQPLYAAEVIATIQDVRGVDFVDLDALGAIDLGTAGQPRSPDAIAAQVREVLKVRPGSQGGAGMDGDQPDPDTIVYLARDAAGMLLLEQIEEEELP